MELLQQSVPHNDGVDTDHLILFMASGTKPSVFPGLNPLIIFTFSPSSNMLK